MLYNYLVALKISKWKPKEKSTKLLNLLEIDKIDNIKRCKNRCWYIMSVENRLNEGVKNTNYERKYRWVSKDLIKKNKEY